MSSTKATSTSTSRKTNRWVQLIIAVLMMMSIACLQYAWELHAGPLEKKLGVNLSEIQYAFTIFIIFQTFIQPGGGYIVDKVGPKLTVLAGVMVGLGWAMMGNTNSIGGLYFWFAVAGAGAALVYGCCVGMASKWFPEKKGLAAGIIAAGYGAGALPNIPLITASIKSSGISSTMLTFGLVWGAIIVIGGLLLKFPAEFTVNKGTNEKKKLLDPNDFTPGEMLKTKHFWLFYICFCFVNFGGLFITANGVAYGKQVGVPLALITVVVSLKVAMNGTARVGWGWISDKIGRYKAMGLAYGSNAVILILIPFFAKFTAGFVILLPLAILTWGGLYSLFPAATADLFGRSYATSNYGFVYSAKGLASLFGGGVGAAIAVHYGWYVAFFIGAGASAISAVIAGYIIPRLPRPTHKRLNNSINASEQSVT